MPATPEAPPRVIDHGSAGKDIIHWGPDVTEEVPRVLSEGNPPEPESDESEAEGTAGIEEILTDDERRAAAGEPGYASSAGVDPDGPGDPDDADRHKDTEVSGLGAIAGQLTDVDREHMGLATEGETPAIQWTAGDGEPTQTLVSKPRAKRGRPPGSKNKTTATEPKETSNVQTTQATTHTNGHVTPENQEAAVASDYAALRAAAREAQEKADAMHRDLIEGARANVEAKKAALDELVAEARADLDAAIAELAELDGEPKVATTTPAPKPRGRPPGAKSKAAASAKPAKKVSKARKPADKGDHTAAVLKVLNSKAAAEGIAASAIAEETGLAKPVVAKTLAILRDAKKAKMEGRNRGAKWTAR